MLRHQAYQSTAMVTFKTIVMGSVLFIINLLGLNLWKVDFGSAGEVRITKLRLAIITSCIISSFVMYCLTTVITITVPGMEGLSVSEIGFIFNTFSRILQIIQIPAVILPVWWYSGSWKLLYETVGAVIKIVQVFKQRREEFDNSVVNI